MFRKKISDMRKKEAAVNEKAASTIGEKRRRREDLRRGRDDLWRVWKEEILPSVSVCAASMSAFYLFGKAAGPLTGNRYVNDFAGQAVFAAAVFAGMAAVKKTDVFRSDPALLKDGWKSSLWYLFLLSASLPRCFAAEISAAPWEAALYLLQMGMVGFCEESLFRGLFLNAFHELFGHDTVAGTRLAVACSGLLFGALHLFNALNPGVSAGSAAVQALGASWIGMYLGAIYVRTGKCLWYCVAVHAVNDVIAGVAAGTLGGSSVADVVQEMGNLTPMTIPLLAAAYGLPAAVVLRKKKLQPVLDALETKTPKTDVPETSMCQ